MSRIGRMPIAVPAGVTVDIAQNNHNKNTDQQHGCWCYQWIYQGTRG